MTISTEAAAVLQSIIDGNKKAAFGDPATLEMLLEASRQEQKTTYQLPAFVQERAHVDEAVAADGTRCFAVSPSDGATASLHILYFHGGGFIMQMAESHWELVLKLIETLKCSAIVPLYPLAPTYTYREAYRSMEAAYELALERCQGKGENLVVMGDSAGGHLAIAAAQTALLKGRPQPSRIIAFSPWLDMADELTDRDERADIDPLIGAYGMRKIPLQWAPEAKENPSFPPCVLHGPFENMAPLLVIAGSREFLLSDGQRCVQLACASGANAELLVYEGMWHVFPLMGDTPEGKDAFECVIEFIHS